MHWIISNLKDVYGKPVFDLKFFFIKIFSITKTTPEHINVYLLYIPLLRIIRSKNKFGINLLLFTWLFKIIFFPFIALSIQHNSFYTRILIKNKNLFEILHSSNNKGVKIFNKNFYSCTVREPYNFPTVRFKG